MVNRINCIASSSPSFFRTNYVSVNNYDYLKIIGLPKVEINPWNFALQNVNDKNVVYFAVFIYKINRNFIMIQQFISLEIFTSLTSIYKFLYRKSPQLFHELQNKIICE